ncbi:MAG: hypothetical protein LBM05_00630 [Endomicrobium sp.]|jgi:hypothetical protein|nr:hypothetical protein [Endomicrobium sp.]
MSEVSSFPIQMLSFSKKGKEWRKSNLDWATGKLYGYYEPIRKSILHKKINYDLLNGDIHMDDIVQTFNPLDDDIGSIPDQIQHYPILNSKLNVLIGEESKRVFDYKVIITNPNAITEIETKKKQELLQELQELIESSSESEDEFKDKLQKLSDYYNYEWRDFREIAANELINHYWKENNWTLMFNEGFKDALAVAEEIYQCDIIGGEPIVKRLNPLKIRIFRSGYSNKVEDADIVILEDYWSPSAIIDAFHESLTNEDIKYIDNIKFASGESGVDKAGNIDPRYALVNNWYLTDNDKYYTKDGGEVYFNKDNIFYGGYNLPYDNFGNIRVIQMYWKSKRKVKKVKGYDPITGEEKYDFYPENYQIDPSLGEEETILWINEAWEGTKIGDRVYVNIRPKLVQYNKINNPSLCHFGIIGSIYNLNQNKPYSLVDMAKQYSYLYDVIHDRLNRLIANNMGKVVVMDFSQKPRDWETDQWITIMKQKQIMVIDSFNEGTYGSATGKIAGGLNNNSSRVIDLELGNSIANYIQLLGFIKENISEILGISRQREGQISSRETVGGVERSNLQSSHITEWLFLTHEDLKKRVCECFIETAKIALRGQNKKFQYIMSDSSVKVMNIDGNIFAENDYGLVVDNNANTQLLSQKLDMLAQAALQNSTLSFSAIMKLYSSISLSEKQRIIEREEQKRLEQTQQQQEEQMQMQEQQMQMQENIAQREMQFKVDEMQLQDELNRRDNETKLLIAQINQNTSSNDYVDNERNYNLNQQKLDETKRQFNENYKLEKEKVNILKNRNKNTNQ